MTINGLALSIGMGIVIIIFVIIIVLEWLIMKEKEGDKSGTAVS